AGTVHLALRRVDPETAAPVFERVRLPHGSLPAEHVREIAVIRDVVAVSDELTRRTHPELRTPHVQDGAVVRAARVGHEAPPDIRDLPELREDVALAATEELRPIP